MAQRTVLITGASSGIGEALAKDYATQKERLLLVARNFERLTNVAEECRRLGSPAVEIASISVADKQSMMSWIQDMDAKYSIDIVIANAGVIVDVDGDNALGAAAETISINVIGVINTIQPCIKAMQRRGRGNIVLISSVAGIMPLPNLFKKATAAYSMSKRFVRIYGEGIRALYTPVNVHVICPGIIDTNMARKIPEVAKAGVGVHPPSKVVQAVKYAISCNAPLVVAPVLSEILYTGLLPFVPISLAVGILTRILDKKYPGELAQKFRYKIDTIQQPATVAITGASSGLGAALASEYACSGTHVILFGRDTSRLAEVERICQHKGARVSVRAVDITDADKMSRCIIDCDDKSPIDIVVANAGVSGGVSRSSIENTKQIEEIISTNINGTLNTVEPLISKMKERRKGHIIIVASFLALRGVPGQPTYCATKAALLSYGESLIMELAGYNIGVTIACCGYVRTPMSTGNPLLMFAVSPKDCANRIRVDAAHNMYVSVYPLYMSGLTQLMNALLPRRISDWIVGKFFPRRKPMPKYDSDLF